MRLDVILFVLTRSGLLGDTIGTTDTPKTDFVDILKQDLRRNNDDYIESTTVSVDLPNPYLLKTTASLNSTEIRHNQTLPKEGKFSYRRGPSNTNLIIDTKNDVTPQRRLFDSLESKSIEATTNKSEISTFRFVTRNATVKRTVRTTTRTLPRSTTLKIVTNVLKFNRSGLKVVANFRSSDRKEDGNKENAKINKIKNFIERNKQLFNEFMNKKRMEARPAGAPRVPVPMPREPGAPREGAPPEADSELSGEESFGGGLRMRARYDRAPLRPDQLDMAPAKGGHVHALRVKGRLCQRSVLVPEGPKYDSRGQQYLGAYGHARGRPYNRTRRPALLLPRCCNCCRKSLLGCE